MNCIDKTNIKKKEAGNGQFLKLKYVTVGLPTNKAAPGSEHTAVKEKNAENQNFGEILIRSSCQLEAKNDLHIFGTVIQKIAKKRI